MIRAQGDAVERPNRLKGSAAKPSPATEKRSGKAPAPVTKVSPRQKLADLARLVERVTKTPLPKPAVNRGGRPKKANALTPAEKQRAYRERKSKEAIIKASMKRPR